MRLYIDTVSAANLTKKDFERLIDAGHILVFTNTVIDIPAMQQHPGFLEEMIMDGQAVIEIWSQPAQMVSKPFFWSSCGVETAPAECLEDAVVGLPNGEDILVVAELMDLWGLERGQWEEGEYSKPAPLSAEIATALNLDASTATRTAVLAAAKAAGRMDLFDQYNVGYCRGLAVQHMCQGILNSDGTVTEL